LFAGEAASVTGHLEDRVIAQNAMKILSKIFGNNCPTEVSFKNFMSWKVARHWGWQVLKNLWISGSRTDSNRKSTDIRFFF